MPAIMRPRGRCQFLLLGELGSGEFWPDDLWLFLARRQSLLQARNAVSFGAGRSGAPERSNAINDVSPDPERSMLRVVFILSPDRRHDWLDGLRAIAALVVLFGHCSNFGVDVVPHMNLASTAKAGVWLFFMLSAYLLGARLIEQFERNERNISRVLVAYGVRRALRIMPLYLVVLAALLASKTFELDSAIRHAVLAEGAIHFWTIPVEMKFYCLLPLIAFVLAMLSPTLRCVAAVCGLIACIAIFAAMPSPRIADNKLDVMVYMPFFALGIGVLVLSRHLRVSAKAGPALTWAGIAVALLTHPRTLAYWLSIPLDTTLDHYLLSAIGTAVMFFGIANSEGARRLLASAPLRTVGVISFGLYLTHYFVIPGVASWGWIPTTLKGATAVVISLATAAACYIAIERPFLRIGSRWARAILARTPISAKT